jgi:hypothetical protein
LAVLWRALKAELPEAISVSKKFDFDDFSINDHNALRSSCGSAPVRVSRARSTEQRNDPP